MRVSRTNPSPSASNYGVDFAVRPEKLPLTLRVGPFAWGDNLSEARIRAIQVSSQDVLPRVAADLDGKVIF